MADTDRRPDRRVVVMLKLLQGLFLTLLLLPEQTAGLGVSWDWQRWWTYDGISGPQFWGLINPEWSLCTNGHRQSPINLDPSTLLYDPNLRPLHVDKHKVSGVVNNTGHSVVFTVDEDHEDPALNAAVGGLGGVPGSLVGGAGVMGGAGSLGRPLGENIGVEGGVDYLHRVHRHKNPPLNITGGPLSYRYRVGQVQLHFGSKDHMGSEHTVNGTSFPAEIQIYGYNSQLFNNFSEAVSRAHGIVAISVMIQIAERGNPELRHLTDAMEKIRYAGSWAPVEHLSVKGLLPGTENYMTYDGSLTQPPCHETVTWVVVNKPIYITKQQLHALRKLHQGTKKSPKAKMVNNFRPTQNMYHRPVRTNIDFTNGRNLNCPTMARQMYYTANTWR
ncbi:carbonic anhydrase-related protein 10-like [Portunus trituberculatus]|uniref:carbonic anhydrase-related protein 10-like n=1 Tax=Portunus trituberculatus TaxID=210409 RepID=UPI001E1CBC35|nr:carbonic anhydrase-related protein 10-like [Portunus trituberculatus]